MNRAVEAVKRQYRRLIQPVLVDRPDLAAGRPDLVTDFVREAYRIGAQVGWRLTSGEVERRAAMPREILDLVIARSRQQADDLQRRLADRALNTPITGPQIANQTLVAGESSVWSGMDTGSEQAARTYRLQLKTWVRAYERKEKRPSHVALEGVTIPLDDLFVLPSGARVYQPRDWQNLPDPAEWVNCGHALRFSQREVTE